MVARTGIFNRVIAHRVDLQRYSKHEASVILELFSREDARLVDLLRRSHGGPFSAIERARAKSLGKIHDLLRDDLIDLAHVEISAVERMVSQTLGATTPTRSVTPTYRNVKVGATYTLDPVALKSRGVVSLPTGASRGRGMAPIRLAVRGDGSFEILAGRDRLIDALESGRPIKATIDRGTKEIPVGGQTTSIFEQFKIVIPGVGFNPIRQAALEHAVTQTPFAGGRSGGARTLDKWFGDLRVADQQRLRGALQLGIQRQETVNQTVARIAGTKANRYADGLLAISRREVEAIVRTSVNHTANSAQVAWAQANRDVVSGMTWTAMMDERTCDVCEGLNGSTVQVDDDDVPPEHPSCFLPATLVSGAFVAGLVAEYSGPAVEVTTQGGRRLSCTPNHPVLTSNGTWVRAGELKEGDELLGYRVEVEADAGGGIDERHSPSAIEYVFEALRQQGSTARATSSAGDLHGDAAHVIGDVEVVAAGCGNVGDAQLSKAFPLGHLRPLQPLRIGPAAQRNTEVRQLAGEFIPRHAETISNIIGIERDGKVMLPAQAAGIAAGSPRKSGFHESNLYEAYADAELVRDLLHREPRLVQIDRVINVYRFTWSGHVYDLQSVSGWLMAEGIVSKNCRCALVPQFNLDALSDAPVDEEAA